MQLCPIDICAVSMFLGLPWPSQSPYLTYKHTDLSRLSEKFPLQRNPTTVRLPENHCRAQRENSEQEADSDKGVWYVNNTTFVLGGQTGKRRQLQSGACDLGLSAPESPRGPARHKWTSHTCWQQNRLQFLIALMTFMQDVMGSFARPGGCWAHGAGCASCDLKLCPTSTALTLPTHLPPNHRWRV